MQYQYILAFDINTGNDWLKAHAQPAADWGVNVGVSTFGLCLLVTLLMVWIKANF